MMVGTVQMDWFSCQVCDSVTLSLLTHGLKFHSRLPTLPMSQEDVQIEDRWQFIYAVKLFLATGVNGDKSVSCYIMRNSSNYERNKPESLPRS